MYAVLKTGGKQYKVAPNDIIMVEKLVADAGTSIEIDEVLMIGDDKTSTIGAPLIAVSYTHQTLPTKRIV